LVERTNITDPLTPRTHPGAILIVSAPSPLTGEGVIAEQ
jgi:hypothetical protein